MRTFYLMKQFSSLNALSELDGEEIDIKPLEDFQEGWWNIYSSNSSHWALPVFEAPT